MTKENWIDSTLDVVKIAVGNVWDHAYEKAKEDDNSYKFTAAEPGEEIKVGDIVNWSDEDVEMIVTWIDDNGWVNAIDYEGAAMNDYSQHFHKTGKHTDKIIEVLRRLQDKE